VGGLATTDLTPQLDSGVSSGAINSYKLCVMDQTEEPKKLSKEEKRRKREEIDRQMAKLAAQAAAYEESGSEEDQPGPSSPPRKRKSDVLAEASPVKHKGMCDVVSRCRVSSCTVKSFPGMIVSQSNPWRRRSWSSLNRW
jgi:hypothetical protein